MKVAGNEPLMSNPGGKLRDRSPAVPAAQLQRQASGSGRVHAHHPLQGIGQLGGLVQEPRTQLLAEPLQRVEGLIELHRMATLDRSFPMLFSGCSTS